MKDALAWPLFITTNATIGPSTRTVTNTYLMQFDIIVKDSVSAPKTGWVFTTLVYDNRIATTTPDIWQKMVVLGAQWGNDPQANNPDQLHPALVENWNNPKAPKYGSETLGWGERLSGPNDGAMNYIAYAPSPSSKEMIYAPNAKDSSCMSCHSSAQWSVETKSSASFLLPAFMPLGPVPHCTVNDCDNYLYSPKPGSAEWMKWFKNRKGDEPMDPGSVAADFDMVLTFKTLPTWAKATQANVKSESLNFDLRGKRVLPPADRGTPK